MSRHDRPERRHDDRRRPLDDPLPVAKRPRVEEDGRRDVAPARTRVAERREREEPPAPRLRPPVERPPLPLGKGRGKGGFGAPLAGKGGAAPPPERKELNRQEVCPLLLRVFVRQGKHHKLDQFNNRAQELVEDEVQIYTWKDATLLELAQLVQQVKPFAKERGALLKFQLVQPARGKYTERYVGTVKGDTTRRSEDDRKMLQDIGFEIGDFLDVAVVAPQPRVLDVPAVA